MNQDIISNISEIFQREFESNGKEVMFFSPGRINVLGEHVDYNDGKMLPAAIDLGIYILAEPREDKKLCLYSASFNERTEVSLDEVEKGEVLWANYILGVVSQFQKKGIDVPGVNLVFDGDLPIGAGLSSSAALECGVAALFNHLSGAYLDKIELVKMAQKAEHEFAGVLCGIMDQFASMMSRENHLIMLDSSTLHYEHLKIDLKDYQFVLIDSCVKHSLASSEYNTRREECQKVLSALDSLHSQVDSYKSCDPGMVEQIKDDLGDVLYRRGKYVTEEFVRVEEAAKALKSSDIESLGEIMNRTHMGLSQDYEVSCKELDFLQKSATQFDQVLGSRMMGGGFGGCTINLVHKDAVEEVTTKVSNDYFSEFNIKPAIISVSLSTGTTIINNKN